MEWKDWPRWFKWGIIGGSLGLITIPFMTTIFLGSSITRFILFPVNFMFSFCGGESCWGLAILLVSILTVIYSFLIGALIGFIYNKIKGVKK